MEGSPCSRRRSATAPARTVAPSPRRARRPPPRRARGARRRRRFRRRPAGADQRLGRHLGSLVDRLRAAGPGRDQRRRRPARTPAAPAHHRFVRRGARGRQRHRRADALRRDRRDRRHAHQPGAPARAARRRAADPLCLHAALRRRRAHARRVRARRDAGAAAAPGDRIPRSSATARGAGCSSATTTSGRASRTGWRRATWPTAAARCSPTATCRSASRTTPSCSTRSRA